MTQKNVNWPNWVVFSTSKFGKEHLATDKFIFFAPSGKCILSQRLSGSEFAKHQRAQGHAVRAFRLYDGDQLCSTIYADFTEQTVMVENQAVPSIKTAFGNNPVPSWEDFQRFLEERCIPRQRAGLREYLEALGLDTYDPLAIIEKTGGRMAEDQQWLSMEVLK